MTEADTPHPDIAGIGPSPEFGTRPGEVTGTLPATFDAGLYFIGRLRTPWTKRSDCPKNARESEAACTVELDPAFEPALQNLTGTSHIWLLYWMDRSPRDLLVQVPKHYGEGRGTFALRSPARPNPIAMSAVKLLGITGSTLTVIGLDCLDGTPLLDIKPYFASTDSLPDAVVGWHRERLGPDAR